MRDRMKDEHYFIILSQKERKNIIMFEDAVKKTTLEKGELDRGTRNGYSISDKIIVVINLQKSNFDNSYYINYGFYVKDIHNDLQYPKNNECDITGRFLNETNKGIYQLDTMNAEELVVSLEKNILNSTTVSSIT